MTTESIYIEMDDKKFNLENIKKFINKLFGHRGHDIKLIPEKKTFKVIITDSYGKKVSKPNYPPNVKEGAILSYYCKELDLCVTPLKDGSYVLKKGCKNSKIIRPLFLDDYKLLKLILNANEPKYHTTNLDTVS